MLNNRADAPQGRQRSPHEQESGRTAPPPFESGEDIIQRTARDISNRGTAWLVGNMTPRERRAYSRDPDAGSRFLGQVVHRETANELDVMYPERFEYRRRGPDFIDRETGERVELTTPGQVLPHELRFARQGAHANIVTYTLP